MEDLSLHILDIVENSIAARAARIEIKIIEDQKSDVMTLEVIDDGIGMDKETQKKVLDPFYTSKTVRRFGLGLPLLSQAAKDANGKLSIQSNKGEGTIITAIFQNSHIDRKPLGDIAQTLITIVVGNPEIRLVYEHKKNGHKYRFDTAEIQLQLGKTAINSPAGIRQIRADLKKAQELI